MAFRRLALAGMLCVAASSAAAQVQNLGNVTALVPIPLASHPQGQALMAQAVQNTTLSSRTAVRIILDRDSQIDETNEGNNFKDEWL